MGVERRPAPATRCGAAPSAGSETRPAAGTAPRPPTPRGTQSARRAGRRCAAVTVIPSVCGVCPSPLTRTIACQGPCCAPTGTLITVPRAPGSMRPRPLLVSPFSPVSSTCTSAPCFQRPPSISAADSSATIVTPAGVTVPWALNTAAGRSRASASNAVSRGEGAAGAAGGRAGVADRRHLGLRRGAVFTARAQRLPGRPSASPSCAGSPPFHVVFAV